MFAIEAGAYPSKVLNPVSPPFALCAKDRSEKAVLLIPSHLKSQRKKVL
jgi:hypothetical protein